MAEIIINKGRYECAPAVASYIKQLERNNLNLQEEFYKQGAKIDELKAENEALKLLIEWAEECDFGYDNFPEEYERYKDEIEGMGYIEGMIHIAKRAYQEESIMDGGADDDSR